jgi:hypothetical protein
MVLIVEVANGGRGIGDNALTFTMHDMQDRA